MNFITRLIGALIVPVLVFRMSGGFRALWPAVLLFMAIGFAAGYLAKGHL